MNKPLTVGEAEDGLRAMALRLASEYLPAARAAHMAECYVKCWHIIRQSGSGVIMAESLTDPRLTQETRQQMYEHSAALVITSMECVKSMMIEALAVATTPMN
jgi:hypothetical protein